MGAAVRLPEMGDVEPRSWVLIDGDCSLCRRFGEWVRRRDRRGLLAATPYQRASSPPMTPALRGSCRRALHVVAPGGRVLRGGRAALFVLERTGWGGAARLLALPPLVWTVEVVYLLVAWRRDWLAGVLLRGTPDPR